MVDLEVRPVRRDGQVVGWVVVQASSERRCHEGMCPSREAAERLARQIAEEVEEADL